MNKELGVTKLEREPDVCVGPKNQKEKGGQGRSRELTKFHFSLQGTYILLEGKLTTKCQTQQLFISWFCHFLHLLQFRVQVP